MFEFMLLLGILAISQTIFLPGFILFNILQIKTESKIQKWVYIFALSLFSNYALVTLLTAIRIYTFASIVLIIIIESFILAYLIISNRVKINFNISIKEIVINYISFLRSLIFSGKVLVILISAIILFYFSLLVANLGTIFYFIDTVRNIEWNTWAIDFSNNIFPRLSSHFPQLIPANWSISYLIIKHSDVHFFPKSYMPLFFFFILLMFLDLAIRKKRIVYSVGLIIYGLFGPIIFSLVFIADGNADLPVSFFAFLSFYAYLNVNKSKFIIREYLLVFLFAATAAGTKLAGFYVFTFLSVVCLYYLVKNFKNLTKNELFVLIGSVVFILLVNLFWYFIKPGVMVSGLNQPQWLPEGYYNIAKKALQLLYYNIGLPVLVFFIITVFISLFTQEARYTAIFFVIPPVILWVFKYSSDFRNLSFMVPFLAYVSAFGLERISQLLKNSKEHLSLYSFDHKNKTPNKKILYGIIISLIVSLIIYFVTVSESFYQFLYWIYHSLNRYYFQSSRINYLIDFTFFIHVDYYQKVFSMMFLILAVICAFYLARFRIKEILLMLVALATVLNFTLFNKTEILNYQIEQFEKVDARNYYQIIKRNYR